MWHLIVWTVPSLRKPTILFVVDHLDLRCNQLTGAIVSCRLSTPLKNFVLSFLTSSFWVGLPQSCWLTVTQGRIKWMGRTGLQPQAHSWGPSGLIKKLLFFSLKFFRLLYFHQKNYIFFHWTEQLTNFCAKLSLFGVDLIRKKTEFSEKEFFI